MELIKVEPKNRENPLIQQLVDIRLEMVQDGYSRLPQPEREHIILGHLMSDRSEKTVRYYLIRENAEFLGYIVLAINHITNKEELYVFCYILKEKRNQGFAKRALKLVIDEFPEGIKLIGYGALQDMKSQTNSILELLPKLGGKLAYNERINISEISKFDQNTIKTISEELSQNADKLGYELIWVDDGKFREHPRIEYNQFLEIVEKIWNDMPKEDAEWEDEVVTQEIYDGIIRNIQELEGLKWTLIAVHKETNNAVAYTDVEIFKYRPKMVYQGDTGVIKEHRGKKLGKTLKYNMLARILHDTNPVPTHWMTGNANSNSHMLAINNELGYEHWYSELYYQAPIEHFVAYFS